ncbi:rhodanese-like domain-containing protein [Georgenia sp. EYE_87]|uniref:rhodanese-like domain-containing protein n=1 Tax=Georgenia sp. EYE_87 TaxID=2853448 RepID=UPI002003BF01|nr:rhodanese-like domain-containing protein [Georgenia sp. EYE_87]MCK6210763.1 rhodanese-like domain-containing protein [Georgenia sp. EYE_87]
MAEVSIDQFTAARADGALVVDVREPAEYVEGHVPGALLVPLGTVPARAGELPTNQPVYVICASGNRSLRAADYLERVGVDARSVQGGTKGWIRAGNPVVTGSHADLS